MPLDQTRWAAETEVVRRLESEWCDIADSPRLRRRLAVWRAEDSRLAFEDGYGLVEAAQERKASSWRERDQVLSAVLERFSDDPLARRVALQIVLPQVKSLIDGLRGWDVEERAARVVAETVDVLAYCASHPAETSTSFRVFANTRRRALRAVLRSRAEPVVLAGDLSQVADKETTGVACGAGEMRLDDLVEWVRSRGRVREDAARLVVMTRAGNVSVSELAAAEDVDAQTLRRRRLRAERRLRQSLELTR